MKKLPVNYPFIELKESLRQNFTISYFRKGEILFSEGSQVKGLQFIDSGKVKVFKIDGNGKEGILRIAMEGDFLGYCGLVPNSKHGASAKALENTVTIFIPRREFTKLLRGKVLFNDNFC